MRRQSRPPPKGITYEFTCTLAPRSNRHCDCDAGEEHGDPDSHTADTDRIAHSHGDGHTDPKAFTYLPAFVGAKYPARADPALTIRR